MLLFPCLVVTRHTGSHIRWFVAQPDFFYSRCYTFMYLSRNSNCLHVTTAVYTDVVYIMFLIMLCRYVYVFAWCSKSVSFFVMQLNENEQSHSVKYHQQIEMITHKLCVHTRYPCERWQLGQGVWHTLYVCFPYPTHMVVIWLCDPVWLLVHSLTFCLCF